MSTSACFGGSRARNCSRVASTGAATAPVRATRPARCRSRPATGGCPGPQTRHSLIWGACWHAVGRWDGRLRGRTGRHDVRRLADQERSIKTNYIGTLTLAGAAGVLLRAPLRRAVPYRDPAAERSGGRGGARRRGRGREAALSRPRRPKRLPQHHPRRRYLSARARRPPSGHPAPSLDALVVRH